MDSVSQYYNLWPSTPQITWGVFAWKLPIIVGLTMCVLLAIVFLTKLSPFKRRRILLLSFVIAVLAIVFSSSVITWLQYKAFTTGFIKYAMPPYKPITYYFVGYAFFTFWATWIVGLAVTLAMSGYWWFIKKQSGGLRINTGEILVFILFGTLSGWPGILVYVITILLLYILALFVLNAIKINLLQIFLRKVFKPFAKFIVQSEQEIRIPILSFFLLAAPVSLLVSPHIFKALHLNWLYIVPRLLNQ